MQDNLVIDSKYKIDKVLHKSHNSLLFLAHDTLESTEVYLRIILFPQIHTENIWQQIIAYYRNVYQWLQNFTCPGVSVFADFGYTVLQNISSVLNIERETYACYFATPTENTKSLLADFCGDQEKIISSLSKVLEVLPLLHGKRIYHYNISPYNIAIGSNKVTLLDIGVIPLGHNFVSPSCYTAPELLYGFKYDGTCDVYSLGMTLFKTLTQNLQMNVVPSEKSLQNVSPQIREIIQSCVEPLPHKRWTLSEVVEHFEKVQGKKLQVPQEFSYLRTCFIGDTSFQENIERILLRLNKTVKKNNQTLAYLVEGQRGEGKSQLLSQISILGYTHKVKCLSLRFLDTTNPLVDFSFIVKDLHIENLYNESDKTETPICLDFPIKEIYLQTKEKLADSIIQYARRKPLVILLDDFHLAHPMIIDVIKYIWYRCKWELENTNNKNTTRLFMVLTYTRPNKHHEAYSFFQEEIYEEDLQKHLLHLQLTPFSLEETGKCIAAILSMSYVPEIFSNSIYKVTKGNKLQIYEILHGMLKQGTLYREDNEWCVDSSIVLPQNLDIAISKHIETLPPLCEQILKLLSLARNPIPLGAIFNSFEVPSKEVVSALFYLVSCSIITINKEFAIDFYSLSFNRYLKNNEHKTRTETLQLNRAIESLKDLNYDFALAFLFDKTNEQEKCIYYTQKSISHLIKSGLMAHNTLLIQKLISIFDNKTCSLETKLWLGEVFFLLNYTNLAEKELKAVMNESSAPLASLRLAFLAYEKNDFKAVEIYLEKSFVLLNEQKNKICLEYVLYYAAKSRLEYKRQNMKQSIDDIQKSLYYIIDNFTHFENKKYAINLYSHILAFENIWKYTSYQDNFLNRGREISQKLNHLPSLALCTHVLAQRKKMEGKYAEALQHFQQSMALWEQIKNPYRLGIVFLELAELHVLLGEYEKPEVFIDRALNIASNNRQEVLIGKCYFVKAWHLYDLQKKEEAEIYFDKATETFQKYEESYYHCLTLCKWLEILLESKDHEEIDSNIQQIEKIVDLISWPILELELCLAKVKVYKESSFEDTVMLLDIAWKIADELSFYAHQWQIQYEYGNALRRKGDIQGALQKYQKAKKIMNFTMEGLSTEKQESFLATTAPKSLEKLLHMLTTELPVETTKDDYMDVVSSYEHSMGIDLLNTLKEETSNLKQLLDINKKLLRERDSKKLLNFIMDTAIELTKAERGFIILIDTSKDKAFEVARNFEKEYIENPEFEISHSITEQVIRTGLPILSENAMEDERFNGFRSVAELNLYSILAVPLASQEKILGALYIDNRFQKSVFSQKEKVLLGAFAIQAALAIENARLIEENLQKKKSIEKLNEQLEIANSKLSHKVEKQEEELSSTKYILHRNKQELAAKYSYRNIIGKSKQIQDLFAIIDKISDKNIPILIQGESGTGKELVARAIHFNSPRAKENFMSENCAAISDSLLSNELFGHDKGAYTNAYNDKKGLFELAHKGTLFLDEVGDMSPSMQVNLLRVLETGYLRRLGGKDKISVDVRIISASNKVLQDLANKKEFREDLFFRLKVVQIDLPALRQRKEDIPLLTEHFLKKYAEENQTPLRKIDQKGMDVLLNYHWPGNIRELRNILYNVLSIYEEEKLTASHFKDLSENPGQRLENLFAEELSIDEYAKRFVLKNQEKYNDSQLSKILGFSRKTLWEKRKKWGIAK